MITTKELDVLVDGGSSNGRLVLADGKLVAIIIRVTAQDADDTMGRDGWFLEAGFGPCSSLMTTPPKLFASENDALGWVSATLEGQ